MGLIGRSDRGTRRLRQTARLIVESHDITRVQMW
jgi:hypothetical protein